MFAAVGGLMCNEVTLLSFFNVEYSILVNKLSLKYTMKIFPSHVTTFTFNSNIILPWSQTNIYVSTYIYFLSDINSHWTVYTCDKNKIHST